MVENGEAQGFTDAEWAVWEPLIEAVRSRGKTPRRDLRRIIAATFWRHRNGATWRAIPAELGPWCQRSRKAICAWRRNCSSAGPRRAWERLLELAQERAGGLKLGLAFLDGTNIRAHAKAAGAPKKGELAQAETSVRPGAFASRNAGLVALAAASAPRRNAQRLRLGGSGVDSQGRAVVFARAPGQAHEAPMAPALLDGLAFAPGWVVGDCGLSSDRLRGQAWDMRAPGGPSQEERGARALPRLHLHAPQPH